ncbi:MAG: right-handed parallel beta-helix repeat-containing protein [Tenuifilaceae bacterium]|jgi:hypothetical protein|nr:right-handed parallel beta-helix repeat-containing protein [Tenuifilaceae bacterium]
MKVLKTIGAIALVLMIVMPASAQIKNLKDVKKKVPVTTRPEQKQADEKAAETKPTPAATPDAATPATGSSQTLYVSMTNGSNRNDGSKGSPFKNIDKAINVAEPGAEIRIAGGVYYGTLNVGFIESNKPVRLYGSFDEDFGKQDIVAHPTLIQPNNESARTSRKALLKFTKDVAGTVIDHIVFDSGERNAYSPNDGVVDGVEGGRLMLPTEKPANMNSTVGEPLLQFVSATTGGDVTVQNCVFLNGASFALQAGHRSGLFTVKNNVFVANKMAAIEIYGTCARTGGPNTLTLCSDVEIANNTILFSWSRLKDFLDMGYGIRIMTGCQYNIHHNVIGASILAGIDHTRFNNNEWISIDHNIFFVNKDKDLHYSPASNTRIRIDTQDFDDLEVASVTGNKNEIPAGLKVNKAYLEGYLGARYSETVDYDPNSPANQWRAAMGMNKQGTISSSATMFANKYPWRDALNLFGNVPGYGAQKP